PAHAAGPARQPTYRLDDTGKVTSTLLSSVSVSRLTSPLTRNSADGDLITRFCVVSKAPFIAKSPPMLSQLMPFLYRSVKSKRRRRPTVVILNTPRTRNAEVFESVFGKRLSPSSIDVLPCNAR